MPTEPEPAAVTSPADGKLEPATALPPTAPEPTAGDILAAVLYSLPGISVYPPGNDHIFQKDVHMQSEYRRCI